MITIAKSYDQIMRQKRLRAKLDYSITSWISKTELDCTGRCWTVPVEAGVEPAVLLPT
jgi:hypothetical protein